MVRIPRCEYLDQVRAAEMVAEAQCFVDDAATVPPVAAPMPAELAALAALVDEIHAAPWLPEQSAFDAFAERWGRLP